MLLFGNIVRYFWPDLDNHEIKKYSILSTIFFLIIGSSWLMRSLKNIIFLTIAFPQTVGCKLHYGLSMQPTAKFWTPFITIPLLLMYSKMIDWYKKETVYYIIIICYTMIFSSISLLLAIHHFHGDAYMGKQLLSVMGWLTFFAVETFYSLAIALLWSLTSSICTTKSAQKGYPVIIVMAQIACIIASLPLLQTDSCGGIWALFLCATATIFSTIFIMRHFLRVVPAHQLTSDTTAHYTHKKHDGILQNFLPGLFLLCTRPYLLGILIISSFYEIIAHIIEYQIVSLAIDHPSFAGSIGFARFQGLFGLAIHCVSLLIALLGTQYFIKKYSLQRCLVLVPGIIIVTLLVYLVFCSIGNPTHTLLVAMGVMILIDGTGYAINAPIKEMLYIPTSSDIKFKSKSWIDVFGVRTAKQSGAQINHMFTHNKNQLIFFGTIYSIILTIIWLFAALHVGSKNKKLIETKTIIE